MKKGYYIYRNATIENLFDKLPVTYSGYDDISSIPDSVDAFIWFYQLPVRFNGKMAAEELESYLEKIKFIIGRIPRSKPFLIFTLSKYFYNDVQSGDFSLLLSLGHFNAELLKLRSGHSNVKIIDFNKFTVNFSYRELIDWKYYYISGMLISPRISSEFQKWFKTELKALNSMRKKCLILDLDNTLWGGILGEDGVEGIKIGGSYPGNAFSDFHRAILQLKESGVMLAVCSKNNENDVLMAWEENKNILIKSSDLVSYKINWKNKADNIAEIITELNIGVDSVVFIDDNPAEREIVKQFIPEIVVPDFPKHPYDLIAFVQEIGRNYFQTYEITREDRSKTLQYKANNSRKQLQSTFANFDDYIRSLDIQLFVRPASKMTITRIAQMTQKTNQFNLTTKRFSEEDIHRLIAGDFEIYTLEVSDKFGDQGITGLVILQENAKQRSVLIDSLLLSCRILGKNIEYEFVKLILLKLKKAGYEKVIGKYIETDRNGQVKFFYDKLGFNSIKEEQKGKLEKEYYCTLNDTKIEFSDNYKLNIND